MKIKSELPFGLSISRIVAMTVAFLALFVISNVNLSIILLSVTLVFVAFEKTTGRVVYKKSVVTVNLTGADFYKACGGAIMEAFKTVGYKGNLDAILENIEHEFNEVTFSVTIDPDEK